MYELTPAALLALWEQGQDQPPLGRALMLLQATQPAVALDQLLNLSIGRRDDLLLSLYEWLFGDHLAGLLACPSCAERIELDFRIQEIRTLAQPVPLGEIEEEGISLQVANYSMRFRVPNSADLVAIADLPAHMDRRLALFNRCILDATGEQGVLPPEELPAAVQAAIVGSMAQADPQADVQLALTCPACAHQWLATFDIVSFLWAELTAWAYTMLRTVHLLASAYGWREADILAMSPRRRQAYLDLLGA